MKVLLRECGDNISGKGVLLRSKRWAGSALLQGELLQYVTGMPPLH
ncbi:MAG: hypothetical protein K0Q67_317 [Cellvibrio sp.]|nr:hypothetical protein [Cellvibrio sp.]